MKNLIDRIILLELKGRKTSLDASIFKISFLLEYTKYKIYEKQITQLLRRKFRNSIFVTSAKLNERIFDDFKNLNTIDDVLNAKELLKEIYFYKETSIAIKIAILGTLSKYIERGDVAFYTNILKDIFLIKDISNILNIVWYSESAFYYLKKVEPKENKKDFFWIKELEDKSVMIMQNNIEFFYQANFSNSLRFLSNSLIQDNDFNSNYIYTFPILLNTEDEHKVTINMHYEDDNPIIDIMFILENKNIFTFKSLALSNLFQIFFKIFTTYDNKFDTRKTYTCKIEDNQINNKIENIQFRYLKRNDEYYLIFNSIKEYHFDVGETFSMFKKIFLFSTLYFHKSKNICLKELSCLSNKDFLMLTGLKC